jgi:hypothetical protein
VPGRRQQDAGEVEPAITSNYTTPDCHLLDAFNELKASRLGAAVEDGVRLVLDNVTELPLGFSSAHVISRPIGPVMVMKDELGRTCPVAWGPSAAEVCDVTPPPASPPASPAGTMQAPVTSRSPLRCCGPVRCGSSWKPRVPGDLFPLARTPLHSC